MGTYLKIDGDPNEISGKGAILRSLGETFRARIQGLQGEIQAIEAERPWGNDKYGQAFESTYNYVPDGSETRLRDDLSEGMSHAGERLIKVGDKTVLAMTEYQATDATNETEIRGTYSA